MSNVNVGVSPSGRRSGRLRRIVAGLALVVAVACALAVPTPARAQIDPGCNVYTVWIGGVDSGRLYRTETGRSVYTEHWVLFSNYVFPNPENGLHLEIRPSQTAYRNVSDFLAATFKPGCRYIKAFTTGGAR